MAAATATAARSTAGAAAQTTSRRRRSLYLTKSLFQKACTCPQKLVYYAQPDFYSVENNNIASSFQQSLANDGKLIGAYSRCLFPDGAEIGGGGNASSIEDLVDETRKVLLNTNNKNITLFEAAIKFDNCLIRADILQKVDGDILYLKEVKAKGWDSRKSRDEQLLGKRGKKNKIKSTFLPYIRDVAFQTYVVRNAFPEFKIHASLLLPDKSQSNTKHDNLNGMFREVISSGGMTVTDVVVRDDDCRESISQHAQEGESLVVDINVDDLVEQVLEEDTLTLPGMGTSDMSFAQVVTVLAEQLRSLTNNNNKEDIGGSSSSTEEQPHPSFPLLPPIGSQCRDCDFRGAAGGGGGAAADAGADPNNDNCKIGQPLSGFETCWTLATGLSPKELLKTTDHLVVDLYHGGKTVDTLISQNKYRMSDVQADDLLRRKNKKKGEDAVGLSRAEKQWYQAQNVDHVVLDRAYLSQEIEKLEYPLHFVDFETIAPVLPFTRHKRPWENLAFQFSHHILDRDGKVEHASEFLYAIPGQCPNQHFLQALSDHLRPTEGTIFRWGAHENTTLSSLLQSDESSSGPVELQFLESMLKNGERAMVDLMAIASKGCYMPGSEASASIKKLLLPTMKASRYLKEVYSRPYRGTNFKDIVWWREDEENGGLCDPYFILGTLLESDGSSTTEDVSMGGDAIVAYKTLQKNDLEPSKRAATESSLKRYCELDTLAMVMITQGLQDLLLQEGP